jgi:hypothetical protein
MWASDSLSFVLVDDLTSDPVVTAMSRPQMAIFGSWPKS